MSKKYIVMTHERSTGKTYVNREFPTEEEAKKHVDKLYRSCENAWCENHKNWIEVK